jgi:hypothetical protein
MNKMENKIGLCKCGCGNKTSIITHTCKKKGFVIGEYRDFISGHHTRGVPKSIIQKSKMAKTRREWYLKNPEKAKQKGENTQMTKILEGTHSGKNNINYGSGKFIGTPYSGVSWNKGKTKETNQMLKLISEMNTNEKNPMWKGDNVGKGSQLHQWIRRHKPEVEFCEKCNKAKPYDVANISGQYKRDINDFNWLCRRCHMLSDGRMKNLNYKKEDNKNGKSNIKNNN